MRSTLSALSKFIALLVTFVLGFLSCIGALVGAGYMIFTKVSIDELEEMGVVNIDTSDILSDDAEVSLTALTLQNLFAEIQHIASIKDEVSVTLLTNRYGLKIDEKLDPYLSQEYKDMPLVDLFSKETLDKILSETMVGDLLGYEKIENAEYDPEQPDVADEYIWRDGGVELTGIMATLASYTIKDVMNISADDLIDDLVIADVLGLTKQEHFTVYIVKNGVRVQEINDIDSINVWCDDDGTSADGIINAIAGFSLDDIEHNLDTLCIGDITGLVPYNGVWYRWSYISQENVVELTEESDVTTELAHVTIAQVSNGELQDEIEEVEISAFLGYTKVGNDWIDDEGNKVDGIMATIADYRVGELDSEIGNIQIGELSGYEYNESTGVWEETDELGNTVPATGILASLADLTVDQMTDEDELSSKVQTITVADAMGFYIDEDGKIYKSKNKTEEVTGFMAVIANEEINNIETSINTANMGDMLGYTYNEEEDWWYDSEGAPVHVMMNSVANKTFENVDTLASDLALSDVIPEEDLNNGFLQLMDPDTKIDSLGESVNETFNNATLNELMGNNDGTGVIRIERAEELDTIIGSHWREQKLADSFDFVIGALVHDWEYYTITVKTASGAPVEGLSVTITDGNGATETGVTDSNGIAVIHVEKVYDTTGAVKWQLVGYDVEFTDTKDAIIYLP